MKKNNEKLAPLVQEIGWAHNIVIMKCNFKGVSCQKVIIMEYKY